MGLQDAPSSEGVPVAGGLGTDPVPAADGPVPAEDSVLVAVQLRLRHHEAGVVLRAAVFDTESGSKLHPLLLVHVVQDGVFGFLPALGLLPPPAAADEGPAERQDEDHEDEAAQDDVQDSPLTVAFSVAEVITNQVLRPERVTGALLGDWMTLTTPRTAELTHDGVDSQDSKQQVVTLLSEQLVPEQTHQPGAREGP